MTPRSFFFQLRSWRLWVLLAAIVALTFVHQMSGVQTSRFQQLLDIVPYVLIMLGAIWFGLAGALACAVVTTACYVTHLAIQEPGGLLAAHNFHRTLNVGMYLVVGIFTGLLAQRQINAFRRQKELAEELDRSYQELRAKTDELFRAGEHVQRANRIAVVGELAAGLAHEIGNPLGGIKGAAEIIADRVPTESEEGRFSRLLLKEVRRLDDVVSRFLDSVRPGADSGSEAVLSEVLDSVLSLSKRTIESQGIRVHLELEEPLPEIAADPHQLYQVFLNLLLNAIQATPSGGTITFQARRRGPGVECSVSDTGVGIPPENLPRLFDPFFTDRPGGTGLGLAITGKILEACGGRIEVESRPGAGATFKVTLPTRTNHDNDPHDGSRRR